MKIIAIGHFSLDVVAGPDGAATERYGGIWNAVSALSSLAKNGDSVVPVFGVSKEEYRPVIEHLGLLSRVETSAVYQYDQPTPRVFVRVTEGRTTVTCSPTIAPPIPFEKIRRQLDADALLVNLVSGFDIALDTLDEIRMAVRLSGTPIHLDYHNVTLGLRENRDRYRRPVQEWRRWAFMVDTCQLNEEEIAGLSIEQLSEEQTVAHLLSVGVKGVLVTRGARGVTTYVDQRKRTVRQDIPAVPMEASPAVGMGDVFGAAFLYQYKATKNVIVAAEFANRFASRHAAAIHLTDGAARAEAPVRDHT
jgi:sugar/nucleoside kinase (ribokinase family)